MVQPVEAFFVASLGITAVLPVTWLAYTLLELPRPFKNMDFLARHTLEDAGKPVTIINLHSASGAVLGGFSGSRKTGTGEE